MTEAALQRQVMLALTRAGCRVFRNQVGKYKLADGRWLSSGLCVGSADLIGWTPDGRFLAIEVKSPGGRLSEKQSSFMCAVNDAGGVGRVVRSAAEAAGMVLAAASRG